MLNGKYEQYALLQTSILHHLYRVTEVREVNEAHVDTSKLPQSQIAG